MKKLVLALSIISCFGASSEELTAWQEASQTPLSLFNDVISKKPIKQHRILLDERLFKSRLEDFAPSISGAAAKMIASKAQSTEINLPLPDGTFVSVKATPSNILSASLAESNPDLKTWTVIGVDDPKITGVMDWTTNGFSGMLLMPDGDTIFIDPDEDYSGVYKSFSKRANPESFETHLNCAIHEAHSKDDHATETEFAIKTASRALDDTEFPDLSISRVKTYRLAMSATAEYTEDQGGFAGALSSMAISINRINPIFERDLGVKFELIDAPELIFSDSATDPFSDPSDPSTLMIENGEYLSDQGKLDEFDIGHVLSHRSSGGGSGVAFLEVACLDDVNTSNLGLLKGLKAAGATTSSNPTGSTFDLVLLAHELGHQLGANHSFNSTQGGCNGGRSGSVAVEPGSGSSIMAYSGLCGSDNLLENPRDDYFHFASISQINNYTRTSYGASCGTYGSAIQLPTVNAGADINVPANTPFLLDGTASGGTTSWDQIDIGSASAVDVDTGDNAIIRHNIPSSDQDRYIPSLADLFAGTRTIGESLPGTTRELNFAYVVRDDGLSSDKKLINVTNTSSIFSVVSHDSAETIATNQTITVNWNKAATDQAPISCSSVDIQLIRESGLKNMLLAATPNDGTQSLVVPDATPLMSDARIFVGCSDNSFFNISQGNILVEQGTAEPVTTGDDDLSPSLANDLTSTPSSSGGGGSFGNLLLPLLALLGLRRPKPVRVRANQTDRKRTK